MAAQLRWAGYTFDGPLDACAAMVNCYQSLDALERFLLNKQSADDSGKTNTSRKECL
jgi:hypothetical protein